MNENAGSEPVGSLIEASNGLLYGMAMKNEIMEVKDSMEQYIHMILQTFRSINYLTFDGEMVLIQQVA